MEGVNNDPPARASVFPLTPNILDPLVALMKQGESKATPVHSNFKYLKQNRVENMDQEIEQLLKAAFAEVLHDLGYNTTNQGVLIDAARLYTVVHAL